MRRRNPFDKSRSPGFSGYVAGTMMGFAFGAIAGWGPGYVMGKGALGAGGAEFAFFGGLAGALVAGALVAARVPRSLILAGGAALALVSWLVFLAAW
jgi:hypothetical protein